MKSVAVRAALLCLFVGASTAAAYVVWTGESTARREADAARQFEHGAFGIEHDVLDLRAAQQAYVAAGQGDEFWILKAAATLQSVRAAIDGLRLARRLPMHNRASTTPPARSTISRRSIAGPVTTPAPASA